MDFITINKDKIVFPKNVLTLDYLRNNGTITLPIIQKDDASLHGFTIEIRLNLNNPVKSIYNKIIEKYPELLNIIEKSYINYGECTYDFNLMKKLQ